MVRIVNEAIIEQIVKANKKHTLRGIWRRIVTGLACIVVFCTVYALILPAITMKTEVFCGVEEHIHTNDCFRQIQSGEPTCGIAEEMAHVHGESCYAEPEATSEPVLHVHTDSCFQQVQGDLNCGLEETQGHQHGSDCYIPGENLICTKTENHQHVDTCFTYPLICQDETDEHVHAPECYSTEASQVCQLEEMHVHTDSCYESILVCELPEVEGHTHAEACYLWHEKTICEMEEGQPEPTEVPDPELICTIPAVQTHVHSDSCYESQFDGCAEDHVHTTDCVGWQLICELEVHEHQLICYSDPTADLETPDVWEATFADVVLTGDTRKDLLAIAQTQLGYHESTRNYTVDADGKLHGYTRYGAWYGYPHGEWCAMFVSFCLNYADIHEISYYAGVSPWVEKLTELNRYRKAGEYTPIPGDLIFFDWKQDGYTDHIGIVAELIPATETQKAQIKVLEGNAAAQVKYEYYDQDSAKICGYAVLPERLTEDEVAQLETVRNLIDQLPDQSEIDQTLAEYDAKLEYEQRDLWYAELTAQVKEVYRQYLALSDLQLQHLDNAQRLLDLEEIWSAPDPSRVSDMIAMIDQLPSCDEVDATLLAYEEAEDMEGYEAYFANVYWQCRDAYNVYQALTESEQALVSNIDRLMDLEYLWSATTLEETYNYSDLPHAAENTRIYLFDYGHMINKKIEGEGMGLLPFYRIWPEYGYTVDGEAAWDHDTVGGPRYGQTDGKAPVINNTLTDGYPYIKQGNQSANGSWLTQWGSLRYLFDPTYVTDLYWGADWWPSHVRQNASFTNPYTADTNNPTEGNPLGKAPYFRRAYLPVKNDGSGTGLFLRDEEGYWYYDSGRNAAWYNPDKQQFELYDYTLIPGHEAFENYGGTTNGNFLPFNKGHVEGRTDYQTKESLVEQNGIVLWNNRIKNKPLTSNGYPITKENFRLITSDRTNAVNLNFGMVVEFEFYMPKDGMLNGKPMEFIFKGDDDVWVFIDDVLVLDIGGCHGAEPASINFATGVLTQPGSAAGYHKPTTLRNAFNNADIYSSFSGNTFANYSKHTLKFFYMERGGNISFCRLRFNMPQLNKNSVSVVKELTSTTNVDMVGDPFFSFQIMKANSNGTKTNTPFYGSGAAGAGKPYKVYDAATNEFIRDGVTENDGIFKIKAGERAEFSGITENSGKYYIRERLSSTFVDQYEYFYVDGVVTSKQNLTTISNTFKGLDSPVKDFSEGTNIFTFNNHVDADKLSFLTITKLVNGLSEDKAADIEYDMDVLLNDKPIPVGTPYTLYQTDLFVDHGQKVPIENNPHRVVTTEGIVTIPGGATAEIDNIIPGTTFHVSETENSSYGYKVQYGEYWGKDWISVDPDGGGVGGTVPVNNLSNPNQAHVCVTVNNTLSSAMLSIPVSKTLSNGVYDPNQTHTYSFTIDLIEINEKDPSHYGVSYSETKEVQVTGGNPVNFNFTINYLSSSFTGNSILIYSIKENQPEDPGSTYDETEYIATVYVAKGAHDITPQLVSIKKKGEATVSGANFVNTLLGDLTLEKTVVGGVNAQANGSFDFNVQIRTDAGTPYQNTTLQVVKNGTAAGTVTTNSDGIVTFTGVKHGDRIVLQGIPLGYVWQITETNPAGYIVSWESSDNSGISNVADGRITADGMRVLFTNTTSYELPQTGSIGTTSYTMGGLLLTAAAVILLYIQKRRRREGR